MPRYCITVEYDGTPYCGWQRQDNLPTVQQTLDDVIAEFCRHEVAVFGAGRTDTGVHATGQVAHFDLQKTWRPEKIVEAMNGLLRLREAKIAIVGCIAVDDEFDARFSATKRHYRYRIINRRAPLILEEGRAWWVRYPLDETRIHDAAQRLVGKHDFTTFRSVQCQAKSPVRTLDSLDVKRKGDLIIITASARAFLHNQVRSLVGTIKMAGDERWSADDVENALIARDRSACAPVAPACGLYLTQVDYE